ncbi:MAG: hypothetical protein ACTSRU_04880 [Candidatus Hodarchaeales archaeon]
MSVVNIDRLLARELIETNLAVIKKDIEVILESWGQDSALEMIERTRRGDLPEAEVDAIALTNLLDKRKELEKLQASIGG